ncbi:hypothetical protein LguiB_031641 [Lonicera macranthoides]
MILFRCCAISFWALKEKQGEKQIELGISDRQMGYFGVSERVSKDIGLEF